MKVLQQIKLTNSKSVDFDGIKKEEYINGRSNCNYRNLCGYLGG